MPEYVVGRVIEALNDRRKPLNGSRVLVLGAAYKEDVDDPRESPAFELIERLARGGAIVTYNDLHIPVLPPMRRYSIRLASVTLSPEVLGEQDCVLICTDHSVYDWSWIVEHSALVVDTRGVTRGLVEGLDKVVRA